MITSNWTGIVESRQDPLNIKRLQIRVHSIHPDDKNLVPTEDLHWAMVPRHCGIIPEGSFVSGYFLDGDAGQVPVVLGAFDGIPDIAPTIDKGFSDQRTLLRLIASPRPPLKKVYATDGSGVTIIEAAQASRYPYFDDEPTTSRLARNENIDQTFIHERLQNRVTGVAVAGGDTWDEPPTEYAARYPYNNVNETESGHIQEFDDTPGAERIQTAHRSGTFSEIYPDGTKVTKIVRPNFTICMSDDNVYIMGSCNITVNGDCNLLVKGDVVEEIMGDKDVTVLGDYSETIWGDKNSTVIGDANETIIGDFNHTVAGSRTESIVNGYSISADTIEQIAVLSVTDTAPLITLTAGALVETALSRSVHVTGINTEVSDGDRSVTINGSDTLIVNGAQTETVSGVVTTTTPTFNILGVLQVNGIPVTVP